MEIKLAVTSIGIDFTCGNIVQLVKRKKKNKSKEWEKNTERNNTGKHKVEIRLCVDRGFKYQLYQKKAALIFSCSHQCYELEKQLQ